MVFSKSAATNTFRPSTTVELAIVKQVNKFDGKRAGDFLEWQSKLRTALSLYNRKIYNVLQGEQRPSNEDPDGAIQGEELLVQTPVHY